MNREILKNWIDAYLRAYRCDPAISEQLDAHEMRVNHVIAMQDQLRSADRDTLLELFAPLWSLQMWGNKGAWVDETILENDLPHLREQLYLLLWGKGDLSARWDIFRGSIKRVGPAMASELLTYAHPDQCIPWTQVTARGYTALGVPTVPRYNYQVDGDTMVGLVAVAREILHEMVAAGYARKGYRATLMDVNFFIFWVDQHPELTEPLLPTMGLARVEPPAPPVSGGAPEFLHDEVKEKLADIGRWLGFSSQTEVKIADGSRVDTVWEATIGNMGRVVYVFEVQCRGSLDGLCMNLIKALDNPAVQGVVAVTDARQIKKLRAHSARVSSLRDKLKTWDYMEVLRVFDALQAVNESINALGLVPEGFGRGTPAPRKERIAKRPKK